MLVKTKKGHTFYFRIRVGLELEQMRESIKPYTISVLYSYLALLVRSLIPVQPQPSKVSHHALLGLPRAPSLISVLQPKKEMVFVRAHKCMDSKLMATTTFRSATFTVFLFLLWPAHSTRG